MSAVRIGRKRANKRLSVHLELDGKPCNSYRAIHEDAKVLGDTARLCRCCWTPERMARAQRYIDSMGKCTRPDYPMIARLQRLLSAAVAALRTPAEQAAHDELIARFATPVTPIVTPTFATVLANYGGTHNAPHREHAARRLARRNLAKVA